MRWALSRGFVRAATGLATLAVAIGFAHCASAGDVRSRDAQPAAFALTREALARRLPTLRALVVARGDCVVFEYYRAGYGPGARFPVYSVTKSVLALLVGAAIDRGLLSLDETLGDLLDDGFAANADPKARAVKVRDLLDMTSGFDATADSAGSGEPATEAWRRLVNRPMVADPGARFAYDGAGANLLSVVLSRVLHRSARRFANDALFNPLHIRNYSWPVDSDGRLDGESELALDMRDMAKIGLLALRRGRWNGAQAISERFMGVATSRQNDGGPPENIGYGYLWWTGLTPAKRDVFFAAGSGDQIIAILPERDLVAAVTAETLPRGPLPLLDDIAAEAEAESFAAAPCVARLDR
jgi:CubicO group peptidase (beta-lactamase class C family)